MSKQRFSDYAIGLFDNLPSRKSVKNAIKSGALKIDGEATNTGRWITAGMQITLVKTEKAHKVFEVDVPVVYEDDYLAIVNKPAGLTTSGNAFRTLENTLPHNLKASSKADAYSAPKPVHRLDRATSGLVLIAKTKNTRVQLGEMLKNGLIEKTYYAVVNGMPVNKKGRWETPIEDKKALSTYELLRTSNDQRYSLLKLSPQTGRTHQLRIHCAQEGLPIVGDKQYGDGKGKGLHLCAFALSFSHPVSGEPLKVAIEMPKKFGKVFEK